MTRTYVMTGLLGAALWGCGGNNIPTPQGVVNRVELQSFAGPNACAELEKYIEDTAVLQMRTSLELQKEGGGGWWWGGDVMMGAPQAEAAGAAADSSRSAPSAYTTTNTQVAGVDEADFVKNDGTRIFVLSGGTLYASQSWPASALSLVGKLKIEGYPREMFLEENDRLVVFSSVWNRYPMDARYTGDACASLDCGYYYSNTVKVTVVDVSNLAAPKETQSFYLPGSYSNSRRVGSSVRLVLSDSFRFPPTMRWYPEYSEGLYEDKARLAREYDRLIAENEKLIRASSLTQWLPPSKVTTPDGQIHSVARACDSFHKTNAPTELGLLTIATLNLANPTQMTETNIIAHTGQVYASAKSLYVANGHWWWWPQPGQTTATYLHKFDLTDPDRAVYVASGKVEGTIVDQFSMDENAQGYFRIASTIASRVSELNNPWGRLETTNRLFVLKENAGALEVTGQSEELAKGERIFSARFTEDKGYVVTFRQVDPLFTFDLSDPTQPRKVGELKIPGFSTYIHPIDDGHLLTIGTFQPENPTDWRERHLQLSIFDVTDLANPRQTFTQQVGTAYGWSEAQYEHKAFNYFPARKLLAIPFFDWRWDARTSDEYWAGFTSDLRVFEVDPTTGFTPKGALSMKDLYTSYTDYGWYYYWTPMVRRSVMADEFVYAISDAGIRVADVANLASPIATVRFDRTVSQ
ncbi:MAG: beta-propeller domain-containing protein [Myxococcota bacterium]